MNVWSNYNISFDISIPTTWPGPEEDYCDEEAGECAEKYLASPYKDRLALLDALCSPCSRSVFKALRISMDEGHMGKACTEDVPWAVKIDYG